MAKQKFYAVKKGNKTGIFHSWSECQEAVNHFSAPEYKSFNTLEEATAYFEDVDIVMRNDIAPRIATGNVVAYTDGSFDAVSYTHLDVYKRQA